MFRKMKTHLAVILLLVMLAAITGCAPEKVDIDWTMHGMWIREDGQVENTFEFHMVGKSVVYPNDPESDLLKLYIQWPEGYRFNTEQANEHTLGFTIEREDSYFLTGMLLSDDLHASQIVPGSFALAPEKGYFLMYWEVPDGSYEIPGYMIASTDPNTSREDIEAFFAPMMTNERFQ